jgi:hypothetical protein
MRRERLLRLAIANRTLERAADARLARWNAEAREVKAQEEKALAILAEGDFADGQILDALSRRLTRLATHRQDIARRIEAERAHAITLERRARSADRLVDAENQRLRKSDERRRLEEISAAPGAPKGSGKPEDQ